ncbi:hypothetical protein ACIQXA_27890 [Streptomyces massasporeus]|uniref:hypothetical protein n=1 Tax=Streptomyces massasporeus TaxID=67324 RepID=UPI0037FC38DD
MHRKPEGSATGALLPGLHTLFVGEEVGADERGVLATDEGFVRGGAAAGGGGGCLYGGMQFPCANGEPVPSGGGPE